MTRAFHRLEMVPAALASSAYQHSVTNRLEFTYLMRGSKASPYIGIAVHHLVWFPPWKISSTHTRIVVPLVGRC